jgi:arylsulfatase A
MSPSSRIAICLALLSACPSPAHAAEPARRPNILFILTDDQARGSLGCYGGDKVPTPHLDSLARDGLLFTDAYATPQCTPTRASLLTGQHTARNGMWHVIGWYGYPWAPLSEPPFVESLPPETFTLPKGLRAAGYATGTAGKWHVSNMPRGGSGRLDPQSAGAYGFDFAAPGASEAENLRDKGVDHLTDQAIGFIERNRDRPWFFYLAHNTTHRTLYAPPELVAKYRAAGAPETGRHDALTLAAVDHLDRSVGRLLWKLDALGLRDDTLVVFQGDNGGIDAVYDQQHFTRGAGGGLTQLRVETEMFDNRPFRAGKGSPYEGGIRVPCLVRWPKSVRAGSRVTGPMHVVDWLPTLLEAAGAVPPKEHVVDGLSLLAALRGGEPPSRPLYWYLPLYDLRWGATPCAVIRDGDWKLIEYFGDRFDAEGRYRSGAALELYNLRSDLGEQTNLAATDPERAAKLRDRVRNWMAGIPVPVPTRNAHFDSQRSFAETKEKQPWNP